MQDSDAVENEALSRWASKQRSDEAVEQLARPLLVALTALTQRTPSTIREELSCNDVIVDSISQRTRRVKWH